MPDVCARGSTAGLTEALQKYLDCYFEARHKKDGKTCKGEETCAGDGRPDGNSGIRGKAGMAGEIERICAACPFLPTKPGNMPFHLAPLVEMVYRMEALFEGGAGVQYPHFYTPLEWECFLTLKHARAKDLDRDLPKPKEQARDDQMAKLRALSHGR